MPPGLPQAPEESATPPTGPCSRHRVALTSCILAHTMHRLAPLLIAIGATACASAPPTEAKAPAPHREPSNPEPSNPAVTSAEPANPPSEPRIAVERHRVSLNGRSFAVETPTKLQKVEPLFAELKDLHLAGAGPRYVLSVADGATGLELKSAFQTAAFAGWTVARWEGGDSARDAQGADPLSTWRNAARVGHHVSDGTVVYPISLEPG